MFGALASFIFALGRSCWTPWGWKWLPVYWPYLSGRSYFVFKDVATVVWSHGPIDVPPLQRGIPGNLRPTHEVVVKLNGVILRWPSWDIDEISCASSDGSPPCLLEVYERYVSFSSLFD